MNVIRYRDEQQQIAVCLLLSSGPKFHRIIPMDAAGIRIKRVPKAEARYFEELADYPLKRALKKFRAAGRKFGITKEARKELANYRAQPKGAS